ncbi:unnamed protein product [Gordionus sp. m RMFG-2023]
MQNITLIIVLGYYRSGASYISELIAANQEVLYYYEPLQFLSIVKPNTNSYDKWRYLKGLLSCNYIENKDVRDYISEDGNLSPTTVTFKQRSSFFNRDDNKEIVDENDVAKAVNSKLDYNYNNKMEKGKEDYIARMENKCKTYQTRMAKVIRFSIKDLTHSRKKEESEYRLERSVKFDFGALNIIHVVRDPRGIVASRQKIVIEHDQESFDKKDLDILKICKFLYTDIKEALNFFGWKKTYQHNNKNVTLSSLDYLIVRYEDAAEFPFQSLLTIYKFLSLRLYQNVLNFVHLYTSNANMSPYSTMKISKEVFKSWIYDLNYDTIINIEKGCGLYMEFLGYNRAKSFNHLHSPLPITKLYSYTPFYRKFYQNDSNVWMQQFYNI